MGALERKAAREEWTGCRFMRGAPAFRADACAVKSNIDQSGNAINEKIAGWREGSLGDS